jgi:Zinc knuckle
VSQFGNDPYKGPAPMVLGALGEQPVCFYCNKPGHLKKDCFKLRNDLASRGGRRGNGRNGGGRNGGGRF